MIMVMAVLSGYITTLKIKQKLDVSSEGPSSRVSDGPIIRRERERYYSDLFVGSNVYSGVKYVFNINIPNDVHKLYWSEVYGFQIYDVLKGENYRCFISFRYYSWGYINFTRCGFNSYLEDIPDQNRFEGWLAAVSNNDLSLMDGVAQIVHHTGVLLSPQGRIQGVASVA